MGSPNFAPNTHGNPNITAGLTVDYPSDERVSYLREVNEYDDDTSDETIAGWIISDDSEDVAERCEEAEKFVAEVNDAMVDASEIYLPDMDSLPYLLTLERGYHDGFRIVLERNCECDCTASEFGAYADDRAAWHDYENDPDDDTEAYETEYTTVLQYAQKFEAYCFAEINNRLIKYALENGLEEQGGGWCGGSNPLDDSHLMPEVALPTLGDSHV